LGQTAFERCLCRVPLPQIGFPQMPEQVTIRGVRRTICAVTQHVKQLGWPISGTLGKREAGEAGETNPAAALFTTPKEHQDTTTVTDEASEAHGHQRGETERCGNETQHQQAGCRVRARVAKNEGGPKHNRTQSREDRTAGSELQHLAGEFRPESLRGAGSHTTPQGGYAIQAEGDAVSIALDAQGPCDEEVEAEARAEG